MGECKELLLATAGVAGWRDVAFCGCGDADTDDEFVCVGCVCVCSAETPSQRTAVTSSNDRMTAAGVCVPTALVREEVGGEEACIMRGCDFDDSNERKERGR